MEAMFAGTCTACGHRFPAKTQVLWARGAGARHVVCPAVPVVSPVPTPSPSPSISMSGVVAFLRRSPAKFPKVRFMAPGGGELRLSIAGERSKAPGSINVVVREAWVGRVTPEGAVQGHGLTSSPALLSVLSRIAVAPEELAREYGQTTGNCSFCNLPLTDAGSVEVGYGPVCAKHYGLAAQGQGDAVCGQHASPSERGRPRRDGRVCVGPTSSRRGIARRAKCRSRRGTAVLSHASSTPSTGSTRATSAPRRKTSPSSCCNLDARKTTCDYI